MAEAGFVGSSVAEIAAKILSFKMNEHPFAGDDETVTFGMLLKTAALTSHQRVSHPVGHPALAVQQFSERYEELAEALEAIAGGRQPGWAQRTALEMAPQLIECLAQLGERACSDHHANIASMQLKLRDRGLDPEKYAAVERAKNEEVAVCDGIREHFINLRNAIVPLLAELSAALKREHSQGRAAGR